MALMATKPKMINGPGGSAGDFDQLADETSQILGTRGYKRLPLDGWFWETSRSRVQLSRPPESAPAFPYIVSRQRYDFTVEGERVLLQQTQPIPIERGADAERIAAVIEDQLRNPY
jgi:hypothetical protein